MLFFFIAEFSDPHFLLLAAGRGCGIQDIFIVSGESWRRQIANAKPHDAFVVYSSMPHVVEYIRGMFPQNELIVL